MHDLIALERLERGTALDPRAMRRQQCVEGFVGFAALDARDRGRKPVAAPRHGLDVWLNLWLIVLLTARLRERASQAM